MCVCMSVSAHGNMCVYVGQKSMLLFSLITLYFIFWDRISSWIWSSPIQLDCCLGNPYELISMKHRDTFRDLQVSRREFRNRFPLRAWQHIHVWFLLSSGANSGSKRQVRLRPLLQSQWTHLSEVESLREILSLAELCGMLVRQSDGGLSCGKSKLRAAQAT